MKNIFYFRYLAICGGIESFFYYLGQRYGDRDITVLYQYGEPETIERIGKYVRVQKYRGEEIRCEKAFFCYNLDIIDKVDADEYYQIVHGDYPALGIAPQMHPKITGYLGVSKAVATSFGRAYGVPCEVAYNPPPAGETHKMLRLVSATRLTGEKGKARMQRLAELMDEAGIVYDWTVFTPDAVPIPNRNIVFRPPRPDILDHIRNADYLVQLSDSEGYCYSVVEALAVGTPVIATNLPLFAELGIVSGKHGFLLDMDLKEVPVDEIRKGLKRVRNWKAPEDRWGELLAEGESNYHCMVTIEVTGDYYDLLLLRNVASGEKLEVTHGRAEQIIEAGLARYADAE